MWSTRTKAWWWVVLLWALTSAAAWRNRPSFQLGWDSFGYYLYLPAAFLYDDPLVRDLSWVEAVNAKYQASSTLYQLSKPTDGPLVIRYPIGLAVIWMPWFGVGHVAAVATGELQDGFSPPYQMAIVAGALIYFLLGLLLLFDILCQMFDGRAAFMTILLLLLGTNLIDQALLGQAMPHLPLFTVYAAVLWFTLRWRDTARVRDAIPLAAVLGIGALIRPVEIVSILIPLLWPTGASSSWFHSLQRQWRTWLVMCAVLLLIGLIQFSYWKLACGNWLIDSYANPGEGLDLLTPHTLNFLFSFRKGWFLYTPMMLVATVGIVLLWRQRHIAARPVTAFFLVNLWVVSSWSCWWYAASFSSRPMVESYPVMAIPLAFILIRMRSWTRPHHVGVIVLLSFCVGLNLFQYWQFRRELIHASRMTREAYLAVWGRTTHPEGFDGMLLLNRDMTTPPASSDPQYQCTRAFGTLIAPLLIHEEGRSDSSLSTYPSVLLGVERPFSPAFKMSYADLTSKDHAWLEVRWLIRVDSASHGMVFVNTFNHGAPYAYQANEALGYEARPHGWTLVTQWYLTPEVRSRSDEFAAYVWSTNGDPINVIGPLILVHEPTTAPY